MDTVAKRSRNPLSKHQIQPERVYKQADAGRDGQICAKIKLSGVNEDRENIVFNVQLNTRWLLVILPQLIQTLLSVIII